MLNVFKSSHSDKRPNRVLKKLQKSSNVFACLFLQTKAMRTESWEPQSTSSNLLQFFCLPFSHLQRCTPLPSLWNISASSNHSWWVLQVTTWTSLVSACIENPSNLSAQFGVKQNRHLRGLQKLPISKTKTPRICQNVIVWSIAAKNGQHHVKLHKDLQRSCQPASSEFWPIWAGKRAARFLWWRCRALIQLCQEWQVALDLQVTLMEWVSRVWSHSHPGSCGRRLSRFAEALQLF